MEQPRAVRVVSSIMQPVLLASLLSSPPPQLQLCGIVPPNKTVSHSLLPLALHAKEPRPRQYAYLVGKWLNEWALKSEK